MADTISPVRSEFAALEHADWDSLFHGPSVVYLLAHARREAFYIDVASGLGAISDTRRRIIVQQEASLPRERVMPLLLVWFEACTDLAAAKARATQLRAWPHAWRRQLVETLNPAWIDLDAYALGFPGALAQVGERHAQCRDLQHPEDVEGT
ncbi:GIY-YIG nuclease family protein [Xanthomonas hortorum]|uniref:Endonuclease n=1 Tax=Xanthomonas hortorum pv. gardneri TaxID=2754056 RepID=A0A6V7EM17_9XANT|nr:GIY-YIG nuclease family protein [Xanthomonas hortorum]MCC4624956.1 GIY-YIG nuclease family protein [Xanthomonas campestris pv. nigromaculans]MCC8500096.1 GIY-YIG nuclease family protein [Xanthomonas hortorum pv. gardneri]MCC8509816.1 GIY-YIG nuclease family protein [Xanthomonas hortorum pv. gardneri]MCC8513623.1 GIY-YIG nuclease family protein [Xanthomonas hortorum pv. gardneri]MCC8522865.1 GIY-YIG nuclease family protein [Xanthomonas hortorum pv. gardneri]